MSVILSIHYICTLYLYIISVQYISVHYIYTDGVEPFYPYRPVWYVTDHSMDYTIPDTWG